MSSVASCGLEDDDPQPRLVITTSYYLNALTYLPDGRRIVTSSEAGTVMIWDVENMKQEGTTIQVRAKIHSLALTQDGKTILCSTVKGSVKVWDVESHQIIKEWSHSEDSPRVAVSPDDRFVAVGNCTVSIHALQGWQVSRTIDFGKSITSMSFSPDGTRLACSTCDGIHVYDVDSGILILGPLTGHQNRISSLFWSRDGSRLISGSDDKTIRCWSADAGESIRHPWLVRLGSVISALSLSPDGSIVTSASWDQTLRFWDANNGDPVGQPLRHEGHVHSVCFSPSGDLVALAGWDGKVYLSRIPAIVCLRSSKASALSDIHYVTNSVGSSRSFW